jgi:hypothetical protein
LLCCQLLQPAMVDFKSKLDCIGFFRSESALSYLF